MTMWCFLPDIF